MNSFWSVKAAIDSTFQSRNLVLADFNTFAQLEGTQLVDVRVMNEIIRVSACFHLLKLKVLAKPKQQFEILP